MVLALYLAILLSCSSNGSARARSPRAILTPGQQQQDAKQAPPEKQAPDSTQPPPAPPAKPADKPKKVITNDDLKSPGGGDSGFSSLDFGQINDCNRNCFEEVRQRTRVVPSLNPNWRRDLLQAIDQVRNDGEWQKYLRDFYDMHLKFCQIGDEKKEELAKFADPNNVTARELAIDDKYDAKFKEAQTALQELTNRQDALQRKFAGNPFAYQFSVMQTTRIQNASCAQRWYPNNSEDNENDQ